MTNKAGANMNSLTPAELSQLVDQVADAVADRLANRPKLLDRHGFAQAMGISVPSVDRGRRDGTFEVIMVGSKPMFDIDANIRRLRQPESDGGA